MPKGANNLNLTLEERIATFEARFENFTTDYNAALEYQAQNSDVFFLLTMSCLVLFMQTGFALLEAGGVRSKNATNILIKNVLDAVFTSILYWAFGYAFAFGDPCNSFIGYNFFFGVNLPSDRYHHWFFQCSFAATACTIISGALAERVEFLAYLCYAAVISGWIYPVITHWAWATEGWLFTRGFQDFAGSGCVHVCGGTIALVSCALLGPRLGRFPDKKSGRPAMELCGHSTPLVTLGGFILAFGFLAFNGGSQGQMSKLGDGDFVAISMVNTVLAGSFGALTMLCVSRIAHKQWSLLHSTNGLLAGMVAICSGCNAMELWAGSVTGGIAGLSFAFWSWLLPKLRVDDPLDAFAVHFGGGLWGLLATPLFDRTHGVVYFWNEESLKGLTVNILGTFAIIAWSAGWALLTFGALRLTKIYRVPADVEIRGVDHFKHKEPAYASLAYGHGWFGPSAWDDARRLKIFPSNLDDVPNSNATVMEHHPRRLFYEHPEIEFLDTFVRARCARSLPPLLRRASRSEDVCAMDRVGSQLPQNSR